MKLKQFAYKSIYYSKRKNIRFGKNCLINSQNVFEGNNFIGANAVFKSSILGFGSYIASDSDIRFTKIEKYCAIGSNVKTFLGKHPAKDFVSIHPAFFSTKRQAGFTYTDAQLFEEHSYIDKDKKFVVHIGNDVWIGNNVLIMDGIIIGDGAIIAAGSIVTKNIEAYTINAGIPSKVIGHRFTEEQVLHLINFKWWDKSEDWIKNNSKYFPSIVDFIKNCRSEK